MKNYVIKIDFKNPRALFEQVRDGVRDLIVSGILQADEKLPSVRELAQQLSINPNTIQKAYHELERDGYLYQAPGRGSFVAPAEYSRNPEKELRLQTALQSAARELLYLGLTREEVKALIDAL